MRTFKIGKHEIGGAAPTFLVAELSANHGQKKDVALRTIEAAAKAGAHAIKLQTYTPDTMTLKSDRADFVVKTKNVWAGRTLHDLYAEAMTPWEWHAELKAAAEALDLVCFSTPFDPTSTNFLETLGVAVHKVASFELTDLVLVEHIARTGKPMILSTGMATLGEIEAALRVCRDAGNENLALLRCVSSYPARPEGMDLHSFEVLRNLDVVVGLSDHTRDHTVAIASVALGAKIIEKHFILDRSVGGPDAFFSLEPDEFAAMARVVRDTEVALGKPRFGPAADEMASTAFRRSLYVAKDVNAGEILTCESVRCVRPAFGLPARHLPEVLGRVAARPLEAGAPLKWSDVGTSPKPRVSLRRATREDSAELLRWRNDATTRKMSVSEAEVTPAEHAAWLERTLASTTCSLFVIMAEDGPVGTARLDAGPHQGAEVSITMAPEARGRKLSTSALVALEEHARSAGLVRLTARIRVDNEPSLRAFRTAGYYAFAEEALDGHRFTTCVRRTARFA
jgi:N-acetylneuraminate synthase